MSTLNDDKKTLETLIEVTVSVLREDSEQETFEEYAHQLRIRLYDEIPHYKTRFFNGYQSILEMIEREG